MPNKPSIIKLFFSFILGAMVLSSIAFSQSVPGKATSSSTTEFNVSPVSGPQVEITHNGSTTDIKALGAGNLILAGNISTAVGESVDINLWSSIYSALLRGTTGAPTIMGGSYYSNGGLFFTNPHGFVIGPDAEIRAANIVVSTLNISDKDFLTGSTTGKYHFTGQGSYIINQGRLIPKPGGYVALLSGAILNEGTIQAQLGNIVLASGNDIEMTTVALDDRSTIFVAVDKSVENQIMGPDGNRISNAIENKGRISVNGGTITLTAKSLNTIFDHSINNSGIIEANALTMAKNGDVVLQAQGASVVNTGTIKAVDNLTISSANGIYSKGSLITSGALSLQSPEAIYSQGVLQSASLIERGATFQIGGIFNPGMSDIMNADRAIVYSADTDVSGTIEDAVNIIIDPNITLTMTGDTNFVAGGSFSMDPTSTINGGNYALTIQASSNVILGTINNVKQLTITAGQDIVQQDAINTNNGDYTAHAQDYIFGQGSSIASGTGLVDIFAGTVAATGVGANHTATTYDWSFLGGYGGYSLTEFGYYFSLGNTIVHLPSLSVGSGNNITTPISGSQTTIGIDGVGEYIQKFTNSLGAPWGTPNTTYTWYSDPALNADGQNHLMVVPAGDESAFINDNNAYETPAINIVPTNPSGLIYNWDDAWDNYNTPGQYFNDTIIESAATNSNALTITPNNQSKIYGADLPDLTVNYAGFVNGDTPASLTTGPITTSPATASSAVGTYSITASGAIDPNYTILYVPGALTVTPANLNIIANSYSEAYGANPLPWITTTDFTTSGLVNGDTVTSVALNIAGGPQNIHGPEVGTYAITPSFPIVENNTLVTSLSNYAVSFVPGSLTVTPLPITIAASNVSKAYGSTYTFNGTNPSNDFNVGSGLLSGDTVTGVTLTSAGAAATSNVAGSPYAITPSLAVGSGLNNYQITYVPGNLTVTPASLTVTASPQTKTYGNSNLGDSAFTTSGLQNGETIGTVSLTTNASTSASGNDNAGTWSITPSNATGGTFLPGNYAITYSPGTLTVNPAALTIDGLTVAPKTYDGTTDAPLNGTPTLTGVVPGDIVNIDGTPTGTFNSPNVTTATTVTVSGETLGGASAGNYTVTPITLPGTITPAALSVTAADQTKTYGNSNLDSGAFSTAGLQHGETVGSVTLATNATTSASGNDNAGTWSIIPSNATGGTFMPSNYAITYNSGILTVNPAVLTVGGLSVAPKTYDGTTSATIDGTPTLTGVVPGDNVNVTGTPVGTFNSPNVVDASTVAVTGLGLGGSSAGNYTLTPPTLAATISPVGGNATPSSPLDLFTAFDIFQANDKVNKIIYETLHPYQLSPSVYQPLVYFYHPLTPIDQSAFNNGVTLDEGAYDFIQNSLELKKLPPAYYGPNK